MCFRYFYKDALLSHAVIHKNTALIQWLTSISQTIKEKEASWLELCGLSKFKEDKGIKWKTQWNRPVCFYSQHHYSISYSPATNTLALFFS